MMMMKMQRTFALCKKSAKTFIYFLSSQKNAFVNKNPVRIQSMQKVFVAYNIKKESV